MSTTTKKPAKYKMKSALVLWIFDYRIKGSRLRQIAREHNIGYFETDTMPDGFLSGRGTRWYCKADIPLIIANCKSLQKAIRHERINVDEKLSKIN